MPLSVYQQDQIGHVTIDPPGPLTAGDHATITITYTAGKFGVDDSGSIKLCWRMVSDGGKPQFDDPKAANYVTVRASNGAGLTPTFGRNNIRPWQNTLMVRATGGFLRAGDQIIITLGDTSGGSPGFRLQTAVERPYPFKLFADAFATYDFVEVPDAIGIDLVPGRPERLKAILPTLRRTTDSFRLAVLAEDRWGNPTEQLEGTFRLKPTHPIKGLPETITVKKGDGPAVIEGLSCESPADLWIDVEGTDNPLKIRSNPLRIVKDATFLQYWGDLHGQSGETVGTGTAAQYFAFARDKAFLDMTGHQGNDFQITDEFWAEINRLAKEYDEPGRFVAFPSYEWSGNTGMGGDRNVYYLHEGRPIYRSSSVLLDKPHDTDCHNVNDLFEALSKEEAFVLAHVGGRYADIGVGHDGRTERAVEIHSCWGTFEWLLHDALALGHRVGIVCHSDDHKGRPGAAWPGAGEFGAIGGLTCYTMDRLDRAAVFDCIRKRHTYGTTGTRLFLDLKAGFDGGCDLLSDDPKLGGEVTSTRVDEVAPGDIVRTGAKKARLKVEVLGSAPIERLTFFNGATPVETVRTYGEKDLGRRIRVLFEGAEYRGRGREVHWNGIVRLLGNRFTEARGINLFNADRPLGLAHNGSSVTFSTVTTGNFCGFDLWLQQDDEGELDIAGNIITRKIPIRDIGLEDIVLDAGGLGKRMRICRLPDVNETWQFSHEAELALTPGKDDALYVRVTQEDGHQAWTSPVYVID